MWRAEDRSSTEEEFHVDINVEWSEMRPGQDRHYLYQKQSEISIFEDKWLLFNYQQLEKIIIFKISGEFLLLQLFPTLILHGTALQFEWWNEKKMDDLRKLSVYVANENRLFQIFGVFPSFDCLVTVFRQDRTLLGGSIPNFDETFGDGFWHGKNDKEAFQIYF